MKIPELKTVEYPPMHLAKAARRDIAPQALKPGFVWHGRGWYTVDEWKEMLAERRRILLSGGKNKQPPKRVTDRERFYENQGGVCWVCGEKESSGRELALDHCHVTDRNRGLLCTRCNQVLGRFGDGRVGTRKTIRNIMARMLCYLAQGGTHETICGCVDHLGLVECECDTHNTECECCGAAVEDVAA